METMPAARIHGPDEIRIDRIARPELGPADVLVEVQSCGICGSDLSYARMGGIPGAHQPFAIGHEFAGRVAAVGAQVEQLAVGDRVVVNPEGADNGIGSSGQRGAFAPYLLFRGLDREPASIHRLPDALDFELGALVEPLSVGMHGLDRGQVIAGDRVVIHGAGPVGLGAALLARQRGAEVVITDLSDHRLAVARAMGLPAFNATSADLAPALIGEHGAAQDRLLGETPATDVYIEATGVGSVFEQILTTARRRARVVVIGVHFSSVELNMLNLLVRELTITASQAYDNQVFARVIELLAKDEIDPRPLISHRFPLSRFPEAFAQAGRADEALKVMIDCQL